MAARDRRSTSVLASASLIRWIGRRLWRSFFLVMFAATLGLLVWALTSAPAFTRLSAALGAVWPEAPLVTDAMARDLSAERDARAAAEAEVAALATRLAEAEARLFGVEAALADSVEAGAAAEALAERRLEQLAATTRRWLDLQREVARLEAEAAESAAP
ncbi:hypothetical protein [Roseicyclus persicicus]|uniref:Uncharacterized protein n=1 Tax=Roseicyclus persicicus TaxID=2650661 RepID=A0A7X6GZ70_9RHOB|nr:hypothetical protein [Roseibacterium persicicum]NKX43822.1 hypothetical protein [Roseibacterium persicicum]